MEKIYAVEDIIPLTMDLNSEFQTLLDSVSYIGRLSRYKNDSAEKVINDPVLPTNGVREKNIQKCILGPDGSMVNFTQYYMGYKSETTVFLGDFYIHRASQNKGYGRTILRLYEEIWRRSGFNKAILNVDIKNWVAVRFWFRNGYSRIIQWIGDKEYSNETFAMLRLEKELNSSAR